MLGALVLAAFATSNTQDAAGPKSEARVEEQVVGPAKQGNFYCVSPRGAHLATVTQKGSRFVVVCDGVEGPKFDDVLNLDGGVKVVFSPDGTRTAYVGRSGQEFVLVVDGKEVMRPGHSDDSSAVAQLAFTSNSKHSWFQQHVHKSNQAGDDYTCIVFDGVAEIPGGSTPVFSPDGEHHAYVATNPRDPNQRSVVLDGKPAGYAGTDPKFTGDGEHLLVQTQVSLGQGPGNAMQVLLDGKPWLKAETAVLYPAPVGNLVAAVITRSTTSAPGHLTFLVIGGKKIDASDSISISRIVFSPDGKRYAAECDTMSNSRFVVVDGKKGQEYQSITSLAFSPDSSRCVYQAMMNGKTFVVIDGEESDGYSSVQDFAFGGGKRIGYCAVRDPNERVVVVDGVEKKWPVLQISGIGFSPDGSRCAYSTISSAGEHLVLDGVEDTSFMVIPFRSAFDSRPPHYLFSADGKHVGCFGTSPGMLDPSNYGFVIDGKRVQTASIILDPTFTPDGRHIFWKVPDAQQRRNAIQVDGQRVAELDAYGLLQGDAKTWEVGGDGVLVVLGQDGEKMKRLRITPSSDTSVEAMIASAGTAAKPAK